MKKRGGGRNKPAASCSCSSQYTFFWHGMVEFVTVYGKDDIRFTMKDGTEIKA